MTLLATRFKLMFSSIPKTANFEQQRADLKKEHEDLAAFIESEELKEFEQLKEEVNSEEFKSTVQEIKSTKFKDTEAFQKLTEYQKLKKEARSDHIKLQFYCSALFRGFYSGLSYH